jgi:hypothetical protein
MSTRVIAGQVANQLAGTFTGNGQRLPSAACTNNWQAK